MTAIAAHSNRSEHTPARRDAMFQGFRLDLYARVLFGRDGNRVQLPNQAVEVLAQLVAHPGELVTRESLQQHLWPDRLVEFDQGLNSTIRQLRKALGDDSSNPAMVATVPRRGYRFIAPVSMYDQGADASITGGNPRFWLLAAIGVGLLILAIVAIRDVMHAAPPVDRPSLVVLPFENYSQDGAAGFFADGLTEDLITSLARIDPGELGVIARTSSMHYRDTDKNVATIGQELGVQYVLEGSSRVQGNAVRIVAQLIRVSDSTHLWAETFDVDLADALSVQRDISRQVSAVLQLKLTPEFQSTDLKVDATAFLKFLRGRDAYHQGDSGAIERSIAHYRRAIELAPDFALAQHGLGQALISRKVPPVERLDEARAALARARVLDATLDDVLVDQARIALFFDRDWESARELLRSASLLDPNDLRLQKMLGYYHVTLGNFETGLNHMRRAIAIDPLSAGLNAEVGLFFMKAGDYPSATRQCQIALDMGRGLNYAHRCMVHIHTLRGDLNAAWRHAAEVLRGQEIDEDRLAGMSSLPPAQALAEYWQIMIDGLERVRQNNYVSPHWFAIFHAQRGESDQALDYLQLTLMQGGSPNLVFLDVDPRYRNLWGEPRFEAFRDQIFRR